MDKRTFTTEEKLKSKEASEQAQPILEKYNIFRGVIIPGKEA
jgi:hypothetical protein